MSTNILISLLTCCILPLYSLICHLIYFLRLTFEIYYAILYKSAITINLQKIHRNEVTTMSTSKSEKKIFKLSVREMVLCALFAALTAIGAFIKIPIPVCPFTLQVLFTTFAGLLLGKKNGALSILIYIIVGLIGFPVFTEGGGISYIFKPTFGYIIGFCIGAYVTGAIAHKNSSPSFIRLLCASFAGLAIIYTFGVIYYYIIGNFVINNPIAVKSLILYCFLLVVPGDIVLCIFASVIAKRIIPVFNKERRN